MEDKSKEAKKYELTIKKLRGILKSDNVSLPTKVPANELQTLVEELFKEENENNVKLLKEQLRELLKKHVQMESGIKEKEKELAKLKKEKQAEFVKASEELFNKISDIDSLTSQYGESLKSAMGEDTEEDIEVDAE